MSKLTKKIQIRTNDEQIESWTKAAKARKVSLSEWIRRVLDATAKGTHGDR